MDTKVTRLSDWKNRDSAQLLRHLAEQLERGNLHGLCLQMVDAKGRETAFFTGLYGRDQDFALSAGLKLSMKMTMLAGGFRSRENS